MVFIFIFSTLLYQQDYRSLRDSLNCLHILNLRMNIYVSPSICLLSLPLHRHNYISPFFLHFFKPFKNKTKQNPQNFFFSLPHKFQKDKNKKSPCPLLLQPLSLSNLHQSNPLIIIPINGWLLKCGTNIPISTRSSPCTNLWDKTRISLSCW